MASVALELAGARIDLHVAGSPPRLFETRYGAFVRSSGAARWRFELHPGSLPPGERMTGRVVVRDEVLRLEGCERHAFLDPVSGQGEALLDPHLFVLGALVRAAMALDVAHRGGCLLHAAALVVDGAAHVAPGRSGAGKSTLAGLAGDVLADEVCAVVPGGDGFSVHGTPWWRGRPGAAPLAAIWTLAWDAERAEVLPAGGALRHLCTNMVVPGVGRAERTGFELCARVATAVPFGRLSFRPHTDVDALLRRARLAA